MLLVLSPSYNKTWGLTTLVLLCQSFCNNCWSYLSPRPLPSLILLGTDDKNEPSRMWATSASSLLYPSKDFLSHTSWNINSLNHLGFPLGSDLQWTLGLYLYSCTQMLAKFYLLSELAHPFLCYLKLNALLRVQTYHSSHLVHFISWWLCSSHFFLNHLILNE